MTRFVSRRCHLFVSQEAEQQTHSVVTHSPELQQPYVRSLFVPLIVAGNSLTDVDLQCVRNMRVPNEKLSATR